jgi:pimeloyl-ACP methyl ester carboxylesterase
MPTISSTSLGDLAYTTRGEGTTALMIMHGWAGSGAYFDAVLEHLDPTDVFCVTLDLPGHGRSGPASTPYTLDLIADAVVTVAEAAGADTFVLLGFSMSAKFAQYVTCRHPDRVLGQILVAGCPAGPIPLPAELVDDWCARAGDSNRLLDVVRSCSTRPVTAPVLDAVGRDAALVPAAVLRDTITLCANVGFADEVAGSRTPTLVVGGSDDWLFPPDALRHGVVEPLSAARLQVLDCGHEIPIEAPEELAKLISEFIAGVDSTDVGAAVGLGLDA